MKELNSWETIKNPLLDKGYLYELYHENSKGNSFWKNKSHSHEDESLKSSIHYSLPLPFILEKPLNTTEIGILQNLSAKDLFHKEVGSLLSSLLQRMYGHHQSNNHLSKERVVTSNSEIFPLDIYLFIPEFEEIKKGIWQYNIEKNSIALLKHYDYSKLEDYLPLGAILPSNILIFITAKMNIIREYQGEAAYKNVLIETGKALQNAYIYSKEFQIAYSEIYDYNEVEIERILEIDGLNQMLLSGCYLGV